MDIDIFLKFIYELCINFPVYTLFSLFCVIIASCWCTYKFMKNKILNDQIEQNKLSFKQKNQIDALKTAQNEVAARNAFLSDRIIDLEEENEELKKLNLQLNKTIQDLENQIETSRMPEVSDNIKTEQVNDLNSKTLEELGFDAMMERNFDKALEYFQKAIQKNPYNSHTYDYMGIAYSNLGNYHEAIEACQNAIDLDCEDATAFYIMGFAYQKLGEHDKANEFFQIKDIIRKK